MYNATRRTLVEFVNPAPQPTWEAASTYVQPTQTAKVLDMILRLALVISTAH
jgi:hypothetical protein